MSLELNKISAAVLIAGLFAMGAGKAADVFYTPEENPEKRGFEVAVAEEGAGATAQEEEVIDIPALLAAADAENGKTIAKKCVSCHSFEQGGANKVGPKLWGVAGAAKGHVSDYAYSDALKAKGGTWDDEALFEFLKKPADYISGTKMAFAGIKKPEQKADLIAYLKTLK